MADDRLERKDLNVLLLWLLAAVIGVVIAAKYFFVAFPEASVDFRVSRPAALEQARDLLTAQGNRVADYQSTIIFASDDNAKNYLERELGLEQANRLMASSVKVWYWQTRFFRPRQKEEFRVTLSPAGGLVGLEHIVEEARFGARLEQAAARSQAERFLRERAGIDLAGYEFLPAEANSKERPNRLDWSFTWERRGFKAKDAPYRIRVGVQGDQVGSYEQFLKVPEAWERDFERIRSSNLVYQSVAQLFFVLLYGAVVVVLFEMGRRGQLQWRGSLTLGAVIAVLFFVQAANSWPLTRSDYDTNSSYGGYFANQMLLAALTSLLIGLSVALVLVVAEPAYRRDFPGHLRLGAIFTASGIRSKAFFRSCFIGLMLAAVHIGYVVLFYVVGRRFGIWVPEEVKYTNEVSTALPWVTPLAIALYAATNEEFLFRLFAIPYLLRLTKSRWVAVIFPAFVWGFLHSAYLVEPGYARGLEVGLIGIVAGLVFLRWGILTTLVWHYTVDASLIGLFLLRSQSLYFRLSGALVSAFVLIPLGVAGVALASRRRFVSQEALLNRAQPLVELPAPVEAAPSAVHRYDALSVRKLSLALVLGALGAALAIGLKTERLGDFLRLAADSRQAVARAEAVLRERHLDPASYRHAVTFVVRFGRGDQETPSGVINEYLRQRIGIGGVNRIYEHDVPAAFWKVRFFRSLAKEEYSVYLTPEGNLFSVEHELDERAHGADLTKPEAQALAEAFLRDTKHADLSQCKLVEANSDKRPARTDHTFVWENLAGIGEAHIRRKVQVLGDEVSGYSVFIKIPDQWAREHTERSTAKLLYTAGRIVFFAAWGIAVIVLFFRGVGKSGGSGVPWSWLARWSLWSALAIGVVFATEWSMLLDSYPTEMPLKNFLAILVLGLIVVIALAYAATFLAFGFGWFFLSRACGDGSLPRWAGMPGEYYRDALVLGLAGIGGLLGLERLPEWAARWWPQLHTGVEVPDAVRGASVFPALTVSAYGLLSGMLACSVVALLAGFFASQLRDRWLRSAGVLLLAISLVGSWSNRADFFAHLGIELITLGILYWAVVLLFRFNLLGYFVALAGSGLVVSAVSYLRQPNHYYHVNGYVLLIVLAGLLAWPLLAWRLAGTHAGTTPMATTPPGEPASPL